MMPDLSNDVAQTWTSRTPRRGHLPSAGFAFEARFDPAVREADDRPDRLACPESAKWSGSTRPCRSPPRSVGRPLHALEQKAVLVHSAARFPAGFGESSPSAPTTRRLLALSRVHRRARRSAGPTGLRSGLAPRERTRVFSSLARWQRRARLQDDPASDEACLAFGTCPTGEGQDRPIGGGARCLFGL